MNDVHGELAEPITELDETVPSLYVGGYVHRADLPCSSCEGEGSLGTLQGTRALCLRCYGRGTVSVGCGGEAERDLHYDVSSCKDCGGYVANETVSPR